MIHFLLQPFMNPKSFYFYVSFEQNDLKICILAHFAHYVRCMGKISFWTQSNAHDSFSITAIHESQCCMSAIGDGLSRMLPTPFGTRRSNDVTQPSNSVTRINSPGQRFTATHGINAEVGFLDFPRNYSIAVEFSNQSIDWK